MVHRTKTNPGTVHAGSIPSFLSFIERSFEIKKFPLKVDTLRTKNSFKQKL